MLQSKNISNVLSQGLQPSKLQSTTTSPLSISLLSSNGLALTTVSASDSGLDTDNIKIFSLLAITSYNSYKLGHIDNNGVHMGNERDWFLLELDDVNLIIQKIHNVDLYSIIFFGKDFPKGLAKLKLENISKILAHRLQNYDNN